MLAMTWGSWMELRDVVDEIDQHAQVDEHEEQGHRDAQVRYEVAAIPV